MSRRALITLSVEGARVLDALDVRLEAREAARFVHDSLPVDVAGTRFASILALTAELWDGFQEFVYVAPCGVAVRALAPLVRNKTTDPAVVVVDVMGRWVVSLLSGHEGGANDLTMEVANALGAEPVVTTSSEAVRTVIAGVGCRRGTAVGRIVAAVQSALAEAGVHLSEVRVLASASIKAHEEGLRRAAEELGVALRLVPDEEIRESTRAFEHFASVEKRVNLPAVAEPAALLAGRRTRLLLGRRVYDGVTVALAREGCW